MWELRVTPVYEFDYHYIRGRLREVQQQRPCEEMTTQETGDGTIVFRTPVYRDVAYLITEGFHQYRECAITLRRIPDDAIAVPPGGIPSGQHRLEAFARYAEDHYPKEG